MQGVVFGGRDLVDVVEAKWSPDSLETRGLAEFRRLYPQGRNFVVSPEVPATQMQEVGGLQVTFTSLAGLRREIGAGA